MYRKFSFPRRKKTSKLTVKPNTVVKISYNFIILLSATTKAVKGLTTVEMRCFYLLKKYFFNIVIIMCKIMLLNCSIYNVINANWRQAQVNSIATGNINRPLCISYCLGVILLIFL